MQTSITYKDAGVDIEVGDQLVERIKPFAKKTMREEVLAGIGGFGAMFDIAKKYKEPVLVSGTDGVGTKLKLAFELNQHDTIGIDLVAMSVNDILVQGAEPLFFLDYFACGKLDINTAADVIKGIATGCEYANCSLIGGETAEMPGMYQNGEYDLAGFALGAVEKNNIIDGKKIEVGDVIIGLASSGFHSNGYSLVRKIIKESNLDLSSKFTDTQTWGEALLKPTVIYVKPILELLAKFEIRGMSHITGGGITGNLGRIFPENLAAEVHLNKLPQDAIFTWARQVANLTQMQMLETFNCGVGFAVIVREQDENEIKQLLQNKYDIKTYTIGKVVNRVAQEVIYSKHNSNTSSI